jgi:hypothetical protein
MGWACGMYGAEEKWIHGLVKHLKEGDHLKDLCTNGRIILKLNLDNLDGRIGTEFFWLRAGRNVSLL